MIDSGLKVNKEERAELEWSTHTKLSVISIV